jgi:drug/metabolite transporter (DMT)-like permease
MHLAYGHGLLTGLAASVTLAAGLALIKSRAEALPAAEGSRILRAILQWIRDPIWVAGLALESAGYLLFFAALANAPVSLVAVMMQGGIAVFVIIAVVFLHERAAPGEAIGIAGTIVAMVLLALSLRSGPLRERFNPAALGALSAVSIIGVSMPWSAAHLRNNGAAPAIASGVAFGLATLYTKALADIFAVYSGWSIVFRLMVSPWLYLMIATNLGGLVLLQNSFHWARGIIAMPLSSAISNLVPIVGGIIAFGESLPPDPTSSTLRIAAFTLTILASIMLARADVTHGNDPLNTRGRRFGTDSDIKPGSSRTSRKR